jgi:erythromycin esterase-like protein
MTDYTDAGLVETIRRFAQPLTGSPGDYDALVEQIGDARLVLLGEASHGTQEFYQARAEISRRLILEKGFHAVAVESDWPDAYRVNCYIQGRGTDHSSLEALSSYKRFPAWMWRNTEVVDFAGWLHDYNLRQPENNRAGFYGLDLYSLHTSMEAVINYLDKVDPEAAQRARYRYSCFEDFGESPEAYGYAASYNMSQACHKQVISQLLEMQQNAPEYARRDGGIAEDEAFFAEQNARLAKNAEEYYRTMFDRRTNSWNLRDCHMAETLENLLAHLERRQGSAKIIVWAHNSHLGDARATQMGERGELNVGQLVRQRFDRQAVLVGFSTFSGTVSAASDWDRPVELKRVRPGLPNSYEFLFHQAGLPGFYLNLTGQNPLSQQLTKPRLERAIGVIYRPETERISHYFEAKLARQFDALLYFDETRAVRPLERNSGWEEGEPPETFPTGV